MLHAPPVCALIPLLPTNTAGNCVPGAAPGATSIGLALIVTVRLLKSRLKLHVAFVPQMTSDVVWVAGGVQLAGPLLWDAGAPQSASVSRIHAPAENTISVLKTMTNWSPESSVLGNPAELVSTAEVEMASV